MSARQRMSAVSGQLRGYAMGGMRRWSARTEDAPPETTLSDGEVAALVDVLRLERLEHPEDRCRSHTISVAHGRHGQVERQKQ